MTASVAAVVVTYNRFALLTQCLDALLTQSRPLNKIFVVDNASSDGTPNILKTRGYLDKAVIRYIRMPENTGGAGGFYSGTKEAYESGYDWIWLMDDDGLPHRDCLRELLDDSKNQAQFRSPLVINIEDPKRLSFGYTVAGKRYDSVGDLICASDGTIINGAQPFNGTLIANSLVKVVGYPKKEMFIWGDEVEYLKRAEQYGTRPTVNLNALFYHPENRQEWKPLFRGLLGQDLRAPVFKQYCFYRNHAYIALKYKGRLAIIALAMKLIIKKGICGRFYELAIVLKAVNHGFRGRWGLEKSFLK